MQKPALLLIHGYPFDHSMWTRVHDLLAPRHKLICPDLVFVKGRAPLPQPASIDLIADQLNDQLEENSISNVVVAGMSMGGYVALAMAEKFPGKVAGLAMVNSHGLADTDEVRQGRQKMIQKVRAEGAEQAAKAAIPKVFSPPNATNPEFAGYPLRGAQKAGVEGVAWALQAMAGRPDRTHVLRNFQGPSLVIHGEEDQFVSRQRADETASLLKDVDFLLIPKAGHCTPLEAPAEVAAGLKRLMERSEKLLQPHRV